MNNAFKFHSAHRKIDFKDVLIVPKKTFIYSRKEINLNREFYFKNINNNWKGCPIISANMDTVSNLETFNILKNHNYLTCFPKHFNIHWLYNKDIPNELTYVDNYMLSCGTNEEDYLRLISLVNKLKNNNINVKFVCVDVANGYMNILGDTCKKLREKFPNIILVAGNVVTPEGVNDLILNSGVNIVKCGIGGGCFSKDTRVLMANGLYKNISDINIGEYVINKNGESVRVKNVINNGIKKVINIKTNNWYDNIYVTPDHQYWIGDNNAWYDNKDYYNWKSINDIETKSNYTLFPNNIKWNLPDKIKIDLYDFFYDNEEILYKNKYNENIKIRNFDRLIESNYDLGYIIGTYLLNRYNNIIFLSENKNKYKILNALKNVFNYTCTIEYNENFKNIVINEYYIIRLLNDILDSNGSLKNKYYCSDKSYIRGIFDGLIDGEGEIERTKDKYNIYSFGNSNKNLIELFSWCCINLDLSFFMSENKNKIKKFNKNKNNDNSPYYLIRTHSNNSKKTNDYIYSNVKSKNDSILLETWDIEVDCDTHSFIANNSIVHNSVCETRLKAGVGYPQLSCVLECSEAAHKLGGYIISDGGIIYPCDAVKAFAGGADFVMGGSIFAGHIESPGETIVDPLTNKSYKLFYGMSSKEAVDKYNNGMKDYRTSEGKVVKIPIKGNLNDTILDINGGIRSACTYVNAHNIEKLYENTKFILVNSHHNTSLS
jgi:IMP dehydrogenase/GMP reductase